MNGQNELVVGSIIPKTTANAYGCQHMHQLNRVLGPLTPAQAELTIHFYKIESEKGKVYAMVFKPDVTIKKTLAEKKEDVVSTIFSYLKKITRMAEKTLKAAVKMFFSLKGNLDYVAVTCKKVALKLLNAGFKMQQFPIAITAI